MIDAEKIIKEVSDEWSLGKGSYPDALLRSLVSAINAELEQLHKRITVNEIDSVRAEKLQPKNMEEKYYPCSECGLLRTKSEGGTTFTVCDSCWNRSYPKNPANEMPELQDGDIVILDNGVKFIYGSPGRLLWMEKEVTEIWRLEGTYPMREPDRPGIKGPIFSDRRSYKRIWSRKP